MDLTPELFRNVEFADARRGGYVHDDVDDFLDKAADALAEQIQQRQMLEARLRAAETRLASVQTTPQSEPSETEETLRRTLVLAQRTADAAIEEAKAEATKRIARADEEARKIVREAQEAVERDVGAKRDQLRSEIAALEVERTSLHDRISRLRGYVDAERSRLKAQLETIASAIEQEDFGVEPAETVDDAPLVSAASSSGISEAASLRSQVEEVPLFTESTFEERNLPVSEPEAAADSDLSKLPPPPDEAVTTDNSNGSEADFDDIGPPTQANPVIVAGSGAGAPHLDELRRAVSQDDESYDEDDAAMAAFFDQDESGDDEKRRFGRRR